jgi:hypothetical protein
LALGKAWGLSLGAGGRGGGLELGRVLKAATFQRQKRSRQKKNEAKTKRKMTLFFIFCGMNCFLCLFFVFFLWYGLLIFWWYDLWFVAIENIQTISSPHNFKNERAENAHDLCFFVFVFWYDVWFFLRFFLRYEL